jgi:hypothetical protein
MAKKKKLSVHQQACTNKRATNKRQQAAKQTSKIKHVVQLMLENRSRSAFLKIAEQYLRCRQCSRWLPRKPPS